MNLYNYVTTIIAMQLHVHVHVLVNLATSGAR